MIRDYSPRRFAAKQKVRDRSGRNDSGPGNFFKSAGIVILLIAVVGLLAGLWVGWAVRSGLDEMGREREQRRELTAQNRQLSESKDRLLEKERMEAAAARQGLFPPTANQVRRP